MARRFFALATVVPLSASLLVAQSGPKTLRTADGQPNLQGVWNFSTLTPLERPAEFAGRGFLTDAEAKAFEARTLERNNRDQREQSPDADVASAYNEFWWDRGVHAARVHGRVRTSLIVDPPDGHVPALTADGQARAAARADARRQHPADGPEDRSLGERFTRTDASTLLYEFTVDDPASFTRPWSAVLPMTRTDNRLYEYACHEGNYALTGILRVARAGEAQR